MDSDHNGPHGTCRFTDDFDQECRCPEFIISAPAGWTCACCQGTLGDDLQLADVLIFAMLRRRIYHAKARALMPSGPASAGHHKRLL